MCTRCSISGAAVWFGFWFCFGFCFGSFISSIPVIMVIIVKPIIMVIIIIPSPFLSARVFSAFHIQPSTHVHGTLLNPRQTSTAAGLIALRTTTFPPMATTIPLYSMSGDVITTFTADALEDCRVDYLVDAMEQDWVTDVPGPRKKQDAC